MVPPASEGRSILGILLRSLKPPRAHLDLASTNQSSDKKSLPGWPCRLSAAKLFYRSGEMAHSFNLSTFMGSHRGQPETSKCYKTQILNPFWQCLSTESLQTRLLLVITKPKLMTIKIKLLKLIRFIGRWIYEWAFQRSYLFFLGVFRIETKTWHRLEVRSLGVSRRILIINLWSKTRIWHESCKHNE